MKYVFISLAISLVLFVVITNNNSPEQHSSAQDTPEIFVAPIDPYTLLIGEMSLEEKIGQLFIVGHWAHTPAAQTATLMSKTQAGGIVIMSSPENADNILGWTNLWQSTSTLPLTIAIDQEGGSVTRLQSPNYTQRAQSDITSSEEASALGEQRGGELAALGINTNLAPVLETSTNPEAFLYYRVFRNPSNIVDFGSAMIQGMREAGVTAVPKHFPGHEDTPIDSHTELPVLTVTADAFSTYVRNFTDTIHNATPQALMTAHVLVPTIDDVYPATLSYTILTEQLRQSIGFGGVIITDDMTMQAITNTWSSTDASLLALQAGADMILFAAKPEDAVAAIQNVRNAVHTGELSEERIDESLQRILKMKEVY